MTLSSFHKQQTKITQMFFFAFTVSRLNFENMSGFIGDKFIFSGIFHNRNAIVFRTPRYGINWAWGIFKGHLFGGCSKLYSSPFQAICKLGPKDWSLQVKIAIIQLQ